MDGWYLSTSPIHYRTHLCHIKETRGERLTDTIQFTHKNITKPTITHADKIVAAIADCAKKIKGLASNERNDEMEQLRALTEQAIQRNPTIAEKLIPTKSSEVYNTPWQAPRDENCRTTRSRTHATATQRVPRVNTQASPRVEKPQVPPPSTTARAKKRRRRRAAHQLKNADAPARNTRSQVRRAAKPTARCTRYK